MSFGKFQKKEIIDLISCSWSPYWGGTGTPGGPDLSIQFNSASLFSGSANFTFNPATSSVSLTGSLIISSSDRPPAQFVIPESNYVYFYDKILGASNNIRILTKTFGQGRIEGLNYGAAGNSAGGFIVGGSSSDLVLATNSSTLPIHLKPGNYFTGGGNVLISGSLYVSSSVFLRGLTSSNQSNVLTINTSTGQVYYTASSAFGTPAASVNINGIDEYMSRFSGSNAIETASFVNSRVLQSFQTIDLDSPIIFPNSPSRQSFIFGQQNRHLDSLKASSIGDATLHPAVTSSLTTNYGTSVSNDYDVAMNYVNSTSPKIQFRGYSDKGVSGPGGSISVLFSQAEGSANTDTYGLLSLFSNAYNLIIYDHSVGKLIYFDDTYTYSIFTCDTLGTPPSPFTGFGLGFNSGLLYYDGTPVSATDTSLFSVFIVGDVGKILPASYRANFTTGIANSAYGVANIANGLDTTATGYVNQSNGIGSVVAGSGSVAFGRNNGVWNRQGTALGTYNISGKNYWSRQIKLTTISGETYSMFPSASMENNDIRDFLNSYGYYYPVSSKAPFPAIVVIPSADYCGLTELFVYDNDIHCTSILPVSSSSNKDPYYAYIVISDHSNWYSSTDRDSRIPAGNNKPHSTTAIGYNSRADGTGSFAGGSYSSARGSNAFAFGKSIEALNNESIAFGTGYINSLTSSFGVGFYTNTINTTPNFFVQRNFVGVNTATLPYSGFIGLRVNNDLWVQSNAYIQNNLYVTGSTYLGDTGNEFTYVSGSLIVNNFIQLTGQQQITGSLIVSNSFTSIGTNTTSGSLLATGSFGLIGNQTISGSILFASASTQYSIRGVDYITFNTIDHAITSSGQIGWNTSDSTLEFGLSGSAGAIPTLRIGEQQIARVYNAEASSITKGQVVYISGSQGNRVSVKLASATAELGSANTLGLVLDSISAGNEGYILTEGPLYQLNTIGLTAGLPVYLSTTAGSYTQTAPATPNHRVILGFVERVHATVGSIYIKVDNGYELNELHNVLISPISSSGDLLVLSQSIWVNSKQLTGSYGLTGSLFITDTVSASAFSGSLYGTASWAQSASVAISSSFASISSNVYGGATNYIPVWSNATTLSSSAATDNGSLFFINRNTSISGTFNISVPSATTQNQPSLEINTDGVLFIGKFNSVPSPVAGGLYYDGTDFYLGYQ